MAEREGGGRRVSYPAGYFVAAPMPTASYRQNFFYQAVSYLLAIVLTLCQLFPTAMLTKAIVEEKETRLKQTMRIMGLKDSARACLTAWLASFSPYLRLILPTCHSSCPRCLLPCSNLSSGRHPLSFSSPLIHHLFYFPASPHPPLLSSLFSHSLAPFCRCSIPRGGSPLSFSTQPYPSCVQSWARW